MVHSRTIGATPVTSQKFFDRRVYVWVTSPDTATSTLGQLRRALRIARMDADKIIVNGIMNLSYPIPSAVSRNAATAMECESVRPLWMNVGYSPSLVALNPAEFEATVLPGL